MRILHEPIQRNYTIRKLHKEWGFAHWHQRVEFVYVLDGVCEIKVGNTKNVCTAGDLIVIHCGEIHSIADVKDSTLYVCTFDPEMIQYIHKDMRFIRSYIPAEMLKEAGIADAVLQNLEDSYRENTMELVCNDVMVLSSIIRIYALLVRHFEITNDEKPQNPAKLRQFQEALLYIEENYSENITLSDVAKVINYNTSYVSSLFVAYTGLNFKTYLDSFRINKAVKLIKRTECTISDISSQCGFNNIRTFNNVFRKITGMTPMDVRNAR